MTNTMWGGRFAAGPAAIMERINASIDFDKRLFAQDIAGSKAHAAMLTRQGILRPEDGAAIERGLDQILQEIEGGKFTFKTALEDIHMNVEARLKEIIGERDGPLGRALYLSRPIQITDPACLSCHTTPEETPASVVKAYGTTGGYGWKLNEIIGAQIVSVPMSLPIENANRAFYTFIGSLAGVFVVLFIILNVMLSFLIVGPITQMSGAADKISTGDMDIPELADSGRDEVALLARSFNRMRRSLEKAITLIDEK